MKKTALYSTLIIVFFIIIVLVWSSQDGARPRADELCDLLKSKYYGENDVNKLQVKNFEKDMEEQIALFRSPEIGIEITRPEACAIVMGANDYNLGTTIEPLDGIDYEISMIDVEKLYLAQYLDKKRATEIVDKKYEKTLKLKREADERFEQMMRGKNIP